MSNTVLCVENLHKHYQHTHVLSNVSFKIGQGRIYGFIGQNGAGKTTILRIIAGLAYPTSGRITLFGATRPKCLEMARRRVGCMIEHAGMYPNLSARENLEIQKTLRGIKCSEAVENVLQIVGIAGTANKKFKDFSVGMKQRLCIASALLGNPELLVLDEPLNGLDPAGIVEIRELIIRLNQELNLTVLISSHILSELFLLATDYIMIHKGRIIEQMTQKELADKCRKHVIIETNDLPGAKFVLKEQLGTGNYIITSDSKIKLFDYTNRREEIARAFHDSAILITELSYSGETLESYYMQSIGGSKGA